MPGRSRSGRLDRGHVGRVVLVARELLFRRVRVVARGLAVCVNGVPSGLARAIQQVADQKAA